MKLKDYLIYKEGIKNCPSVPWNTTNEEFDDLQRLLRELKWSKEYGEKYFTNFNLGKVKGEKEPNYILIGKNSEYVNCLVVLKKDKDGKFIPGTEEDIFNTLGYGLTDIILTNQLSHRRRKEKKPCEMKNSETEEGLKYSYIIEPSEVIYSKPHGAIERWINSINYQQNPLAVAAYTFNSQDHELTELVNSIPIYKESLSDLIGIMPNLIPLCVDKNNIPKRIRTLSRVELKVNAFFQEGNCVVGYKTSHWWADKKYYGYAVHNPNSNL